MKRQVHKYLIKPNGSFPNNPDLPVILYKKVINVPVLFPAWAVKKLFRKNGWTNNWAEGIYEYDHYHSNTHEAMAVIKGKTTLLLGGKGGKKLDIEKGDVIIIPAGVAHCNLGKCNAVQCVGGYPQGKDYDMNYGHTGEMPKTRHNIDSLSLPEKDPVFGAEKGLVMIWQK